jgi:hypothetical protein
VPERALSLTEADDPIQVVESLVEAILARGR